MTMILAQYSLGRIALHVACITQDRRVRWHVAGILRECFPNHSFRTKVLDRLTLRTALTVTILVSQCL